MNCGHLELRIVDILKEKHISKNKLCKDMEISRPNLNRYCNNNFQRLDAVFLCKLCYYFNVDIAELVVYHHPK